MCVCMCVCVCVCGSTKKREGTMVLFLFSSLLLPKDEVFSHIWHLHTHRCCLRTNKLRRTEKKKAGDECLSLSTLAFQGLFIYLSESCILPFCTLFFFCNGLQQGKKKGKEDHMKEAEGWRMHKHTVYACATGTQKTPPLLLSSLLRFAIALMALVC